MNPLTGPAPKEVPLADAPLECVLAQVKFPMIMSINDPAFVGPFQEAIRDRFPDLKEDRIKTMRIDPNGGTSETSVPIWRFSDDEQFQVSLAPDFIALQTKVYKSRTDFVERLRYILTAFQRTVKPSRMERVGIRYIDRVRDATNINIKDMVIPEILGTLDTWMGETSSHVFTESQIDDDGYSLLVKWGRLPPQATLDPAVVEPMPTPSWVLDIDAFTVGDRTRFEADAVADQADFLAQKCYAFFRWAVTDTFLRTYGGAP